MKPGFLKAVVYGGLLGGAGDLAFALAFAGTRGTPPMELLQVIASGVFGKAAFDGGATMALAGAVFHFAISLIWAAAFVAFSSRFAGAIARPPIAAIAFGIVVFFAMRLAVLPLSAFPFPVTFKPLAWGLDLLSHVFLFALPIVSAAKRYAMPDA